MLRVVSATGLVKWNHPDDKGAPKTDWYLGLSWGGFKAITASTPKDYTAEQFAGDDKFHAALIREVVHRVENAGEAGVTITDKDEIVAHVDSLDFDIVPSLIARFAEEMGVKKAEAKNSGGSPDSPAS